MAFRVDTLSLTEFWETEVDFSHGGLGLPGSWNCYRHHHVDAHKVRILLSFVCHRFANLDWLDVNAVLLRYPLHIE